MIQNPTWYRLIKLLRANDKITTGLTLPYIYGAYELLGKPFLDIEEMLNNILENPIDKFPLIQKCPEIQQHVIMVEKKEICNKYYNKFIRFENKQNNNKLFISDNTDLGKSIEKVYSNLKMTYLNPIERKEYCWDKKEKKWIKFSDEEIVRIMSLK